MTIPSRFGGKAGAIDSDYTSKRLTASDIAAIPRAKDLSRSRSEDKTVRVSLIDGRSLERKCFRNCLVMEDAGFEVVDYASTDDWQRDKHPDRQVILLNLGAHSVLDEDVAKELAAFVKRAGSAPVIVMSECTEITGFVAALDAGAAGNIPPGAEIVDVVEAIHAALSGGVFVPKTSLGKLRRAVGVAHHSRRDGLEELFTERQLAVARALQRGATNKIIAHELNIGESTVKVHIRSIMRKLKATNRTQAAYRLTEQMQGAGEGQGSTCGSLPRRP